MYCSGSTNEDQSRILTGEIFLIAAGLGFYMSSWYVFGGVLIGLMIALFIPYISILLMLLLSISWGVIGYWLGQFFSVEASYVLAGLGFIMGLGVHFAALEWSQDIGK
jgi:hypothetical protein